LFSELLPFLRHLAMPPAVNRHGHDDDMPPMKTAAMTNSSYIAALVGWPMPPMETVSAAGRVLFSRIAAKFQAALSFASSFCQTAP
jgi:hypothetical protein